MNLLKWLAKFIWAVMKDERGEPMSMAMALLYGSGIVGGSSLLGGLLGGEDEETQWNYPGQQKLGSSFVNLLKSKLGQRGTAYPNSFNIPQPGIEAQTESILSNKLGNLPKAEDYKAKVEASKTQQIAREKERAADTMEEEKNMYNRLGLVSSSPWLGRAGELGEESLGRQKDIETGMDIYGLEYGLNADKVTNEIANQYLTQGQVLGQAQRGYEKYPIEMNYSDWLRQEEEPYKWAGLTSGFLGGNPPTMTSQPNLWSNLATTGQDIGSLLMMYGLLGGGGGKTAAPKLTTV